jgi:hypothetical protein
VVRGARLAALVLYLGVSLLDGLTHFAGAPWVERLHPLRAAWAPVRLVNTYHLFGHITRERIEPVLESFDGTTWREHDLRHKPGDPARRPGFVAPHQPRLDFQLWFYGLSYRHGTPAYVAALLERACRDPRALDGAFAAPLPATPEAVRLVFYEYHFTSPAERRSGGAWWRRDKRDETRPIPCR